MGVDFSQKELAVDDPYNHQLIVGEKFVNRQRKFKILEDYL